MIKNGIFLFIFAFFVLAVFLPSYSNLQDLRSRNAALQEEVKFLEQKNKDLLKEKKLLTEDPVYLEAVGREKLGIVRDGEMVLKLRKEEENKQPQQ